MRQWRATPARDQPEDQAPVASAILGGQSEANLVNARSAGSPFEPTTGWQRHPAVPWESDGNEFPL